MGVDGTSLPRISTDRHLPSQAVGFAPVCFCSSWEPVLIRILLARRLAFLKHMEFIQERSLLTVGAVTHFLTCLALGMHGKLKGRPLLSGLEEQSFARVQALLAVQLGTRVLFPACESPA